MDGLKETTALKLMLGSRFAVPWKVKQVLACFASHVNIQALDLLQHVMVRVCAASIGESSGISHLWHCDRMSLTVYTASIGLAVTDLTSFDKVT